jgi:hypothetical protein
MTDAYETSQTRFLLNARLPLQLRLDTHDVVCGLRPGARVLVRDEVEAGAVAEYVGTHRCEVAVSRGVLYHNRSPQGFADWLTDQGEERMIALYISATLARAEELRDADEAADDSRFGTSLGYPPCCVRRAADEGVPAISTTPAAFATPERRFDPLLWPPAMLLDRPLLPHIPCGPGCEASRRLALARLESLRRDAPPVLALLRESVRWRYRQTAAGAISAWDPARQVDPEEGTVYYPLLVRELA